MWFYGVDAAQAAAREPVAWFVLIVIIAALLTWAWYWMQSSQDTALITCSSNSISQTGR